MPRRTVTDIETLIRAMEAETESLPRQVLEVGS